MQTIIAEELNIPLAEVYCVVTFYAEGAPHPFHVVSLDEEGIYGWVDADTIRPD